MRTFREGNGVAGRYRIAGMRVAIQTVLIAGTVAAGVLASASAGASTRLASFRTPSGNIICAAVVTDVAATFVECGIKSGLVEARPHKGCKFGDPTVNRVQVPARGRAGRVLCAGDPGPFALTGVPILPYGRTWRGGGIACASKSTGLTCTNHDRHGFLLSRERWRVF
jgi:hypothetical protein